MVTGARALAALEREARRMRFLSLRERFLRDHPEESPIRLIAQEERVTVWTVYDVLRCRKWGGKRNPPKSPKE